MNTTFNHFEDGRMRFCNSILHVEYNQNIIIDQAVLYRQIECRQALTANRDFFMVVDLRNVKDVTDEAVELAAANPKPKRIKAIAMITRYGEDYIRAKLYTMFDTPNIQTKTFLSIEEAKAWFENLELDNDFSLRNTG